MKKNPYQFTIRFNSTIAGHCQAAAFLNRCGTRAKAHVIAEALDLYLREKKQLLGLGELERIEVVPEMNGQEQREDKPNALFCRDLVLMTPEKSGPESDSKARAGCVCTRSGSTQ